MEVGLLLAAWLLLILIGMPVAPALIICCLGFMAHAGYGIGFAVQRMVDNLNSFPTLAVPLFIFAGHLFNSSGITRALFQFSRKLAGHIPGGLGHVNVLVSLFFSGMSGSAIADSGGLGLIEIQAMRDEGYDDAFSGSITAASSIIGPIIPPSITMVLYGVLTETSIGRLFAGGVFTGLACAAALMIMVYITAKRRAYPVFPRAGFSEVWAAFRESFWALLTPLVIIGGIFSGLFSPTEAAAITVLYALLIDALVYRNLNWASFTGAVRDTVRTSASVGFIIAAVGLFGYIIARERVPELIASLFLGSIHSPGVFLIISCLIIFVLGMFIESLPILLMIVPILAPIAVQSYGIDPIHYGVLIVLNLMISTLTPPMGMSLLVVSQVAGIPFGTLAKGILPWLIPPLAVTVLLILFPGIATFLPSLL